MKEWLKKNKIILAIFLALIIAGFVILLISGFNKDNYYASGKKIEVSIPKGYEIADIKAIASESFNNKEVSIEEIETLGQVVAIKLKTYTEEELETFKSKIMEKYEIEEDDLTLYEIDLPITRIRTFIAPYVWPTVIATIITFIYIAIKSAKKKKVFENILKIIIKIFLAMGTYFSLILIFRIPFGAYIMPIAMSIYLLTLLISSKDI